MNRPSNHRIILISLLCTAFFILGSITVSSTIPPNGGEEDIGVEGGQGGVEGGGEGGEGENGGLGESGFDAAGLTRYTFTYDFSPELRTRDFREVMYDDLGLDDCIYTPDPGKPQVPFFYQPLFIAGSVEHVQVSMDDPAPFYVTLPPAPEATSPYDPPVHYWDPDVWSADEFYPGYDFSLDKVGLTIGMYETTTDYSLSLFPVQYNPFTGLAVVSRSVTVDIFVDESPEAVKPGTGAPEGFGPDAASGLSGSPAASVSAAGGSSRSGGEEARDITQEPARGSNYWVWDGVGERKTRYLIITVPKFHDDLQQMIDWKEKKGYPVEVVDVDWIKNNVAGNDTADKMRNYIKQVYYETNTALEYVLLAGDHDIVPTRVCDDISPHLGWDDGKCPSDTYFACLGQDSARFWNADLDNNYAEQGELDDLTPEVFVTRIALNGETKMKNWAREVVEYEMSQPAAAAHGDTTTLIAGHTHDANDAQAHSNYLYNKWLDVPFTNKQMLYEGTHTLNSATINAKVNGGTAYINFIDHGGPTEWCDNYGAGLCYVNSNVAGTSNENVKPVITAMACLTNWFDDPSGCQYENFAECLGEAWTENNIEDGAIGYAGFSRSSTGALACQYYPAAEGLQEDFGRQIYYENLHLGKTFLLAKQNYVTAWASWWSSQDEIQANWVEFNYLGEPEVPMWTDPAGTLKVTTQQNHEVLEKVTVRVTNMATTAAVENALVCLENTAAGTYAYRKTDSLGEAYFEMKVFGNTTVNLTVTMQNYQPYESTMDIIDMTPPITTFRIDPQTPDGSNNWYHTQPTVYLDCNEPGATVFVKWSGGPAVPITGNSTPAEIGGHELTYYAVDLAGNKENDKKENVNYDSQAPKTTIVIDPAEPNGTDGWYIVNRPLISVELDDDYPPSATTYLSWDGVTDWIYDEPFEAKEGEHELIYYTKDMSGHVEAEKTMVIKVDTSGPSTYVKLDPGVPDGENNFYISPVNVTLMKESAETQAWYAWDSSENYKLFDGKFSALDGVHVLKYYSVDPHGNTEAVQTQTIKCDLKDPLTNLSFDPAEPDGENGWYVSEVKLNLTHMHPEDRGNSTIYFYWGDDPGMAEVYTGEFKAREGAGKFNFWAEDLAGNKEAVHTVELKVDTLVPVSEFKCSVRPDAKFWYRTYPSIQILSDADATVYYALDGSDETEWRPGFDLKLQPGLHSLRFYAVDEAGNREKLRFEDINVDTAPPELVVDMPSESVKGDKVTIDASASTDDVGIEEYFFDYGDGKTSGWTKDSSVTHKYNKTGKMKVIVKARDASGQETAKEHKLEVSKPSVLGGITGTGSGGSDYTALLVLIIVLLLVVGIVVVIAVLVVKNKNKKKAGKKKAAAPAPKVPPPSAEEPSAVEAAVVADPGGNAHNGSFSVQPAGGEAPDGTAPGQEQQLPFEAQPQVVEQAETAQPAGNPQAQANAQQPPAPGQAGAYDPQGQQQQPPLQ